MTTEQHQEQREQQQRQEQREDRERHQDDRELFDDSELQSFRARWEQVQGEFVDEPRESVQKADDLVSDLVKRLTSGFAETRSGLEEQWNKGEDASTEDLRVALTRYRAFFQRLLKV
jgi:hypothetical protein